MKKDILICGVGGQGTVLASKILAASAMVAGDAVHSAETIGMAQRGGPVTSHVRIGDDAYSPLIPFGSADLILAFEPSEAVRNLCYLKKGGTVIVNSVPVKPVTESLNDTGYDGTEMLSYLRGKCDCIVIDGEELNIAILGVAAGAGRLGIPQEIVLGEIVKRVPARFTDTNKAAFQKGAEIGVQYAVK